MFDVAIIGSGPAAWAIAAAFADTKRSTVLVGPEPTTPWSHTYGGWEDQLDLNVAHLVGVPCQDVVAQRWPTVQVVGDRNALTGRSYVRFDNGRLIAALMDRASATCDVVDAAVKDLEASDQSTTLRLEKRKPVVAKLVVDATGAQSRFIQRAPIPSPAVQSAYGIVTRIEHASLVPGTATLMDWRGPDRQAASFLYALPLADHRWLLEETSLARRIPLSMDELRTRLYARLNSMGITVGDVETEELVEFRVEVGMPDLTQRVVGFGAAASMTHPATGYTVVQSLRAAKRLVSALDATLDRGPHVAAAAGWKAIWTEDRVKARRLEQYGLTRLLDMNQRETRAFFDAFFSLKTTLSASYVSGEASSADVAKVMWDLFRKSPRHLQAKLASGNPLVLAKSLLGS